ncbi:DgyrCDS2097 [Dimorphilus gyrociliatus]|uniref:DgyrCDS2097 n=1 Tax=Dimorphilus gyrociliatus TaxID=2664684 RepID=A0A7I8V992_9ANNE|nr:DgyrCDS2097 [Dimorphilus gyrociliatus]
MKEPENGNLKSNTFEKVTVDRFFELTGEYGFYQKCFQVYIMFCELSALFNMMSIVWTAYTPEHVCNYNGTLDEDVVNVTREQCRVVAHYRNATSKILTCDSWTYSKEDFDETVATKYDLVCERAWLKSSIISFMTIGQMLGNMIIGHLADKFGRRKVIIMAFIVEFISFFGAAFNFNFYFYVFVKMVLGGIALGVVNTHTVHATEIVGKSARLLPSQIINLGWSIFYVLLGVVAIYYRHFRSFYLTIPGIVFVYLLITIFVVDECPRWLLVQGRKEEAMKIFNKIKRLNGHEDKEYDIYLDVVETKSDVKQETFSDLLRSRILLCRYLNLGLCWAVNALVYYGLSLNTGSLAGDKYVNFIISGAVEFPAYALNIFVMYYLGKRLPISSVMVFGGLGCILASFVSGTSSSALSLFGKFCITMSFGLLYVVTPELTPTTMRTYGLGICSTMARVGSILAPFAQNLDNVNHYIVPLSFGFISMTSGLLIMTLPETHGKKLPENRQDAENFGKGQKLCFIPRTQLTKFCMRSKREDYKLDINPMEEKTKMMA